MPEKQLTVESSMEDFKRAYRSKSSLIKRQREDFLFRLGKQWDEEKFEKLKKRGITPVTDNRIQPNIFLLTGLQRQNRADFKAFPEGEEDSLKAEIATMLFKNSIKVSGFGYKVSEAFEDGITCGESYLELYLDNTYNLLNGKPCWKKIDYDRIFPEPGFKEYDYSDARYIYKLTKDMSIDDLISIFPDKRKLIENADTETFSMDSFLGDVGIHKQPKDYGKKSGALDSNQKESAFDLLERYYKKWVEKYFVGDRQTGEIKEAEDSDKANKFVVDYQQGIQQEQDDYQMALMQQQMQMQAPAQDPSMTMDPMASQAPPQMPLIPPTPRDPERFTIIKRYIPEIWYFAHTPGIEEPLADEKAWFYPKWKQWAIIPYLSHFSTAPLTGEDRHLLVQGIVHGVKGAQEVHNSSETLMLMHLNGSANSGWLTEEDTWVDPKKVQELGATPSVNLEYKIGKPIPTRIFPMQLSTAHEAVSERSAEAIKSILGINADLLAVEQSGSQSGKAIDLRMRQGLVMVQKPFDNLSQTQQIAGKLILSQLGEIYDTETAKKVLGESFLQTNFPPPLQLQEDPNTGMPQVDPATGQPIQVAIPGKDGQPMTYDEEMADLTIAEVLSGDLGQYDVSVGEAVASETMKLANSTELSQLASSMPGLIPPDVLIEESGLNPSTKKRILTSIQQAQQQAQAAAMAGPPMAR